MIVTRLERLRGELAARELDGFLVTDILNVRYLSGFTGTDAVALVTTDDAILITDFRYAEQSAAECPGMILELVESHWVPGAQRSIGKHDLQRIGRSCSACSERPHALSSGQHRSRAGR